jgi:hypothetical protein
MKDIGIIETVGNACRDDLPDMGFGDDRLDSLE